MNYIDYIFNLSFPKSVGPNTFGLVKAYCFCLTPDQGCVFLHRCVTSLSNYRGLALEKVRADINNSFDDCHLRLLKDLLSLFSVANPRVRQSLGYCLSMIEGCVPEAERLTIQEFFLTSNYVGMRKRGYKCATAVGVLSQELVRKTWERFGDYECALIIVQSFPPEFLVQHRAALAVVLTGGQLARLYLRIAEIKPKLLVELRDLDEISYCYVLAMLGKTISLNKVINIINSNLGDKRFGLLVWSLGRLHMWEALRYIESQLPAIQEQQRLADLYIPTV